MPGGDGGEGPAVDDRGLAPVIPLFGGTGGTGGTSGTSGTGGASDTAMGGDAGTRGAGTEPMGDTDRTPGAGRPGRTATTGAAGEWDRTWVDTAPPVQASADGDDDEFARAEASLLRRLRTRQLSSNESRTLLREHDLAADAVETLVARFESLGYLDDARLAEQLVHAAVTRKGQGRRAVALALTARGIPRAAADEALAALPDDDHERAVEFARSKVRRAATIDREAALRRLVGQLSRRGYPSAVALSAAREALDERT